MFQSKAIKLHLTSNMQHVELASGTVLHVGECTPPSSQLQDESCLLDSDSYEDKSKAFVSLDTSDTISEERSLLDKIDEIMHCQKTATSLGSIEHERLFTIHQEISEHFSEVNRFSTIVRNSNNTYLSRCSDRQQAPVNQVHHFDLGIEPFEPVLEERISLPLPDSVSLCVTIPSEERTKNCLIYYDCSEETLRKALDSLRRKGIYACVLNQPKAKGIRLYQKQATERQIVYN